MNERDTAVVLLSGGQDSTTVFFDALRKFDVAGALSFDYGQRHKIELLLAAEVAASAEVPHVVLQVSALRKLSASTLTDETMSNVDKASSGNNAFAAARGLPPSFTPGRNLLFFTMGAMYAAKVGATVIVTGVCQQDRDGYPDCRAEFVNSMEESIHLGFGWDQLRIYAPLLHADKAATWQLAHDLAVLSVIVHSTNSCYEGDREHFHPWGYGCGKCGACIERSKGWNEYSERTARLTPA